MSEKTTDGRLAKGEQRRRELIAATISIVAREGVAGVSHRAVAREAGLQPTAAAYYYKAIDDLLTAALTQCMEEDAAYVRDLAESGEAGLRGFAEQMARAVAAPVHLVAEFELFLLASRRPELRKATANWTDALAAFARSHTDSPARVRALAAAVDGMLIQALVTDDPPTVDDYEEVLRDILEKP
ncbi:TetR/AcrR family transcriptional regulator [Salininema proteolyticum]|uniref:TetR/AcrR family transcriptional regulator n=1 Tax=Salininema proteolyticum TaxID=1607685 RepID=A0ABV8TY46_9ACTN